MSLGEWVEFQLEYCRLAPFTSPIAAQALNDMAPDSG
jgi:hypothetical protein